MIRVFLVILTTLIFFTPLAFAQNSQANILDQVNQKVCNRFEEDVSRLSAIMEELKNRQGIKETRVAFGGIDTKVKSGDYWVNFAAEAIAFQRVQKYSSKNELRYSLEGLKGKILKAKNEVGKALDEK